MGTIKDLVDLTTRLADSVKDRKIATEFPLCAIGAGVGVRICICIRIDIRIDIFIQVVTGGSETGADDLARLRATLRDEGAAGGKA